MAKSDLLKEAIADAKAVKETALANAKIALQEAFQPRIKKMLENELMNELEDDDMMDDEMDGEMDGEMDDMNMDVDVTKKPRSVGVGVDLDMDGSYDIEGELGAGADSMEDEFDYDAMEMGDEAGSEEEVIPLDTADDMDMDLDEIIRELDGDLGEEEDVAAINAGMYESASSIEELIEAILAEEEYEEEEEMMTPDAELKAELDEAYKTVSHLKNVINEVNLLNAKLLYTNKLFRNFELSESQKMKVIESFDRAANTREAKLVFSTIAESFKKPRAVKRIVKESKPMASRPVSTTAPSKRTTRIITEGFEQADRWKKLAGLI
jgi:hypothetical protein